MEIERSTVIARPPEELWGYVADPRNDPQWCQRVESVEQVTGEEPGRGAGYRVVHRPVPFRGPVQMTVTIEEYAPPRRLRFREEDEEAAFEVSYELEPIAAGTRLTQRDRIEWRKLPSLGRPIARWFVGRTVQRQLSTLKRLLEAT